jgi:hypothetical protein
MAAGATYEPIATTTLGSNTHTVTFSSIPGTYTDLVLVMSGSITTGATDGCIVINSDTANNYSRTYMYGNGSSAASGRNAPIDAAYGTYWDTGMSNSIWHFMNYSNTTTYKTILTRNNAPSNSTYAGVGIWRSTSAITRLDIQPSVLARDWVSGSTFTLYGITAA